MANDFCVNKSGSQVPVYGDSDGKSRIGTLNNREAFGFDANWGGDLYFCRIVFRNRSGQVTNGFIIDPAPYVLCDCTDYPYGTAVIKGTEYKTFIMRKSRKVYTTSGRSWGTVAANCRVACKTALSGDANPHWKAINYVESTAGMWVPVTGDGETYGFVDTGLSVGSGYATIPFYGSW